MHWNKYHNHKVETEDGTFDSVLEAQRWEILKAAERDGRISELQRQVEFTLVPRQKLPVPRKGKKRAQTYEMPIRYKADFVYVKDGELVVEDAKGYQTDEYRMKRKLMLYEKGIEIKEITKNELRTDL